MDYARAVSLFGFFAVCGFCGCQPLNTEAKGQTHSHNSTNSISPTNLRQHTRDNCASLLYDLLNDEKDLGKLLIIKRESKALNDLVKEISTVAEADVKKLDRLAAADRTLHLQAAGLPFGEVATRTAVGKTKTSEFLHAKGADFEFKLLLSQAEALNYGAHLAKVAGENEPQPDHARAFSTMSEELKRLYERVIAQLKTHEYTHH